MSTMITSNAPPPAAAATPSAAAAAAVPARVQKLPREESSLRNLFGRRTRMGLASAASVILCLAVWQYAAEKHLDLGVISFVNIPAPTEVFEAAKSLAASPKILAHIRNSLYRVFAGFAAAAFVGVPLGLAVGRSKWIASVAMPPLEMLRPIPGVAWIPIAILMFPSSEVSMVFITFMGALFPILLNTIHGVEAVDARLVSAARSLGAGQWTVFLEVIFPGALPCIVTGLSIGMGTSWFCLVTAEMISGQFGIGYYTWESYTLQRYPEIVVGMIVIGIFGMGSSALIKSVGSRCMPWMRLERNTAK